MEPSDGFYLSLSFMAVEVNVLSSTDFFNAGEIYNYLSSLVGEIYNYLSRLLLIILRSAFLLGFCQQLLNIVLPSF